jgi:hypothetical protein
MYAAAFKSTTVVLNTLSEIMGKVFDSGFSGALKYLAPHLHIKSLAVVSICRASRYFDIKRSNAFNT